MIVYVICGALAGLGGIMVSSRLNAGDPKYGTMYELEVIAAVVVGGTSLMGGEGRMFGTLIGAFIIAVIRNGMNLMGVNYRQSGYRAWRRPAAGRAAGSRETDEVGRRLDLSIFYDTLFNHLKQLNMQTIETEVLFRPDSAALRFLPEGPYSLPDGRMSWVGIQHGADSKTGSINILNPADGTNESFALPGRPGFAFPTDQSGVFVTGFERSVGLFDTRSANWSPFISSVDATVSNTIINDAVVFDGNLIFGLKELEFKTKKAGLYLWRRS